MGASVGGYEITNVSFNQAVGDLTDLASALTPSYAVTLNVQSLQISSTDAAFRSACEGATARYADGKPILWAARAAGQPIIARVAGADLEPALCGAMQDRGGRMLYIGGEQHVNDDAVRNRSEQFPGLQVSGFSPHFNHESDPSEISRMIDRINDDATHPGPFAVMMCTGAPRSELFAAGHIGDIHRGLLLCAGAAVDFAAGAKKRPSKTAQNIGFEWLGRLRQEPKRLGPRYARNAAFLPGLMTRSLISRFSSRSISIPEISTVPVAEAVEEIS